MLALPAPHSHRGKTREESWRVVGDTGFNLSKGKCRSGSGAYSTWGGRGGAQNYRRVVSRIGAAHGEESRIEMPGKATMLKGEREKNVCGGRRGRTLKNVNSQSCALLAKSSQGGERGKSMRQRPRGGGLIDQREGKQSKTNVLVAGLSLRERGDRADGKPHTRPGNEKLGNHYTGKRVARSRLCLSDYRRGERSWEKGVLWGENACRSFGLVDHVGNRTICA